MTVQGLSARLSRIEAAKAMRPRDHKRVFVVVAAQGDEAAADELAASRGYQDGSDLLIRHVIVTPEGKPRYDEPPYISYISGITEMFEDVAANGRRIHDPKPGGSATQ